MDFSFHFSLSLASLLCSSALGFQRVLLRLLCLWATKRAWLLLRFNKRLRQSQSSSPFSIHSRTPLHAIWRFHRPMRTHIDQRSWCSCHRYRWRCCASLLLFFSSMEVMVRKMSSKPIHFNFVQQIVHRTNTSIFQVGGCLWCQSINVFSF